MPFKPGSYPVYNPSDEADYPDDFTINRLKTKRQSMPTKKVKRRHETSKNKIENLAYNAFNFESKESPRCNLLAVKKRKMSIQNRTGSFWSPGGRDYQDQFNNRFKSRKNTVGLPLTSPMKLTMTAKGSQRGSLGQFAIAPDQSNAYKTRNRLNQTLQDNWR